MWVEQVPDRDTRRAGPLGQVAAHVVVEDSRPSRARSRMLIAVNCLVTEATWNTDSGVIGTPSSRLARP